VWQSVHELTDGSQEGFNFELEGLIADVKGVQACREVRHRSMGPNYIVDTHIQVDNELTVSAAAVVAERVRTTVMKHRPEVTEMTVNVSPAPGASRMNAKSAARASWDRHPEKHGAGGGEAEPEIEDDVRGVLQRLAEVRGVAHVAVHYLGGGIQVRCEIMLDPELQIKQANMIARQARKLIESEVEGVSHADIHLELQDDCFGEVNP
ncbi:hypothetical protein T484DRAFT_1763656, partial [Baffinella frigidus]